MRKSRKYLSAQGLLHITRNQFNKINPPRKLTPRADPISLTDCLMSGLAMFSLKFPSLLKFDESRKDKTIKHNLYTLYGIEKSPCDTYMRTRLDEVHPNEIRKSFKRVFSYAQRGKVLEEFSYLDNHYLFAGDGTGFFESNRIHCENCCVRQHNKCQIKIEVELSDNLLDYQPNTYLLIKNILHPWEMYYIRSDRKIVTISISNIKGLQEILLNRRWKALTSKEKLEVKNLIVSYYNKNHPESKISYYHHMFCAAIVHPNKKIVLPFAPEPIMKSDGSNKNDCEHNASKRLYANVRREHPNMKFIVVQDALASNAPHLAVLKTFDMRYTIGIKPGSNTYLFDLIKNLKCTEYSNQTSDGTSHYYRYINQIQLNKKCPDVKINFLEYWGTDKDKNEQHFSWITDLTITDKNVYHIMRGGRVNWKIENNTFNTLKNQYYHFSHNFGHGSENLSTNFSMLMLMAFFIDQIQELSCSLFKKARAKFRSRTSLWDRTKSMFKELLINKWDDLFNAIAYGCASYVLVPDTS